MERFEFDSKTGPNGNRREGMTRRGAIELNQDFEFLYLDIRGPAGAQRGSATIDKATAGKLGAALLKWAMPDNKALREHFGDVLATIEALNIVSAGLPCMPKTGGQQIRAGEGFIPRFVGDKPDAD
jgi:hypothetical protein